MVRGFCVRNKLGVSMLRSVVARDFDSVPGVDESGRTVTSKVALEGFSLARRTSIGPEMEARAWVEPFLE